VYGRSCQLPPKFVLQAKTQGAKQWVATLVTLRWAGIDCVCMMMAQG